MFEKRPVGRRKFGGDVVVFAAAFLLFSLELAVAKALLPRFGGSPMVWTASMLAYQILLMGGYAYAHGLANRFSGAMQAYIHTGLLLLALTVAFVGLRVAALSSGDPAMMSQHPLAGLLRTLLGSVAIPFLAVSATSPLVQHWQQRLHPERSTYRLYAVSNVGSFAGLLAYPFAIEPWLSLDHQFALWTAAFALTSLGLMAMAGHLRRASRDTIEAAKEMANCVPLKTATTGTRVRLLWLLLPATTSALLLSATNELCQDLAVFPFLWVLPLSLYLLSFSLTFRDRPMRSPAAVGAGVTVVALGTTSLSLLLPAPVHVVSINTLVLVLCLTSHRELYRLRPPAQRLTSFYLHMAAGSGLGAACVALLAPATFTGYWEFHLSIMGVWITVVMAIASDPKGALRMGDPRQAVVLLGILCFLAFNQVPEAWLQQQISGWPTSQSLPLRIAAAVVLAVVMWYGLLRRYPYARSCLWPRVLVGLIIFMVECSLIDRIRSDRNSSGHVSRNFFGVVRVQEVLHQKAGIQVRQLTHGNINHGWQYMNPELHFLPTAYHSPSSGIGRLLRALQEQRQVLRIGVTGLGAGALAAYPRATDSIVFYEIDPQVVALSSGPAAAFSFLNHCPGKTEIVMGDARQSMQIEFESQGGRAFDVLALDAFSSDAIPMHLLTHEAIALYMQHLVQPGGVLAVNISNRFLDIEPVVNDAARELALHAVLIDSTGDGPVRARSLWVLLSRDEDVLRLPLLVAETRPLTASRVAWTDTYGSPFQLMKWWQPYSRHQRFVAPWRRRQAQDEANPQSAELSPEQRPADRTE